MCEQRRRLYQSNGGYDVYVGYGRTGRSGYESLLRGFVVRHGQSEAADVVVLDWVG